MKKFLTASLAFLLAFSPLLSLPEVVYAQVGQGIGLVEDGGSEVRQEQNAELSPNLIGGVHVGGNTGSDGNLSSESTTGNDVTSHVEEGGSIGSTEGQQSTNTGQATDTVEAGNSNTGTTVEEPKNQGRTTTQETKKNETNFSPFRSAGNAVRAAQETSDLKPLLSEVFIDATKDAQGNYVVKPNGEYTIKLRFTETEQLQMANNGKLTYTLPTNFPVVNMSNVFNIKIKDNDVEATLENNNYSIKDNVLTVEFNKTNQELFNRLSAMGNVDFQLEFKGRFSETINEIAFNSNIKTKFVFDRTANLTIRKEANHTKNANKVEYKLTITSEGTNHNVVITDKNIGTALTSNQDVVVVSNQKGTLSVSPQYDTSTDSFTISGLTLNDGEVLTVTYTANVHFDDLTNEGLAEETKNIALVQSDEVPEPKKSERTVGIVFDRITKVGKATQQQNNPKEYLVNWVVEYNKGHLINVGGKKFEDFLNATTKVHTYFVGTGVKMTVTKENGQVEVRELSWTDPSLIPIKREDGKIVGWNYNIPIEDGKAYYKVEVQSLTDTTNAFANLIVTNYARVSKQTAGHNVTIQAEVADEMKSKKELLSYNANEMLWKITVPVPPTGYSDETNIYDDVPRTYFDKTMYHDSMELEDITIEGLLPNESYKFVKRTTGTYQGVNISFYKDKEQKINGLSPSPDGTTRQVVITLKTKVNQEWLDLAHKSGYANSSKHISPVHTNTYSFWVGPYQQAGSAQAIPKKQSLNKAFVEQRTASINGVTYPVFAYTLEIANPLEGEVIKDTFNKEYLRIYNEGTLTIGGRDAEIDSWNTAGTVTATDTDSGADLKLTQLPKNGNNLYATYQLTYELIVKDRETLARLQAAAFQNEGVTLKNTATWNGFTSEEVSTVYRHNPILDKKLIQNPSESNSYTAIFELTLNEGEIDAIPNQNVYTVKDVLSTALRFLPDSVEVLSGNYNLDFGFDPNTNTVTFNGVPDNKKVVIRYSARVLGKGDVPFQNTVSMGTYTKTITSTVEVSSSGSGTASNPSITIIKQDKDKSDFKLAGAQFKLTYIDQDGREVPVKDKDDRDVIFTTKNDGTALIEGNQSNLGWVLWKNRTYLLREIQAPTGYQLLTEPIQFVLTDTPENQSQYQITGEKILVINERPKTEATASKVWENIGPGIEVPTVYFKLFRTVNGTDWEAVPESEAPIKALPTGTTSVTWSNLYRENLQQQPYTFKVVEVDASGSETTPTDYVKQEEGLIITNTYDGRKEIEVTKKWTDANNQDGKRPESIVVRLFKNGNLYQVAQIKASANWKHTFKNLPKFENAQEVVYTIEEDEVTGYDTPVIDNTGYIITNSRTPEKTSVSGTKTWNDANNQDRKRPESITVHLLADGEKVQTQTVRPDGDGNWKYSFTDLDKFKNGVEIRYSVSEEPVAGYTSTVTGNDITNSYSPEKTSVSGTKTWNDANNQDRKRPESITVHLLADGEKVQTQTVRPDGDGNWKYSFTDLDKFKNGVEIRYSVSEEPVAGYTSTVTGNDITNSYSPEKTSVSGTKTWNDANNQDGKRPESITVHLLADGEKVQTQIVRPDSDGNWKYSFTDLDKFKNGVEIRYSVSEEPVAGYTSTVTDYDITNSYSPEKTSVSGTKTWNDANNQDGKRPESITVHLLADGEKVQTQIVRPDSDGNWEYSFTDLDKFKNGVEIRYSVSEEPVAGYTSTVTGNDITNSYSPEKTSVSGTKTWNDANNQDGKRPESITVHLLAGGEKVQTQTVRPDSEGNWKYSFTDLDKFKNGVEIRYSVSEEPVAGYTSTVTGNDITNSYTPEKTSVSGTKTWNDANNQDGKRPESITVHLLADGEKVQTQTVTPDSDGNWKYSFTDLDKFKNGVEIRYSVSEEAVAGYTSTVTDYDITNSYSPEKTSVSGTKTWNDANNQDGKRPESITVHLLADGEKVQTQTVTPDSDGNWKYSFTDLDKFKNGVEIRYSVSEEAVAGYTSTVTDYDITNSYSPEKTSVSGTKTWNDANNQDGKRPESITVHLLADGEKVQTQIVTPDSDGNWKYSFTDLDKFKNGVEIRYSVSEEPVAGYTSTVTGNDITNSYTPEVTELPVAKVWNDANNQDGKRPKSIFVQLYADGKVVPTQIVELSEENNWTGIFTHLAAKVNGKTISYTAQEVTVPEGYTASTALTSTGVIITNTYNPETLEISGTKTWNDANNQDGKRPKSITVQLLANGQVIESKEVTASTNWTYSFTNLPRYREGVAIVYTVAEKAVSGYLTTYEGFDITNSYTPEMIDILVNKNWDDANNQDGKRPESITIELYANDEKVATQKVTPSTEGKWVAQFTGQPRYREGKEIVYTVREVSVEGYTTIITGENGQYTITNTHAPEKRTLSGQKMWNDNDNQDGIRPETITVELYANGVATGLTQVATATTNWTYNFADLDRYQNGQEVVYTVQEVVIPTGYKVEVSGMNLINHHTPEVIAISGTKTWDDANNQDGIRPQTITVHLFANGVATGQTATASAESNWKYHFTDLPKYQQGKEVVYTVGEEAVAGYKITSEMGMNLTNTHLPDTIDISGTKTWDDANNQDGIRPQTITVHLFANGVATGQTTTASAESNWKYSFNNLPKNKEGKEIVYTIKEEPVKGYKTSYNGFDITNSHTPEKPGVPPTTPPKNGKQTILPSTNGTTNIWFVVVGLLLLIVVNVQMFRTKKTI